MIYLLIKIFFLLNLFFQSISYAYSENKLGFSLNNFPESCEKYKRKYNNVIFGYKKETWISKKIAKKSDFEVCKTASNWDGDDWETRNPPCAYTVEAFLRNLNCNKILRTKERKLADEKGRRITFEEKERRKRIAEELGLEKELRAIEEKELKLAEERARKKKLAEEKARKKKQAAEKARKKKLAEQERKRKIEQDKIANTYKINMEIQKQ